MLPTQSGGSRGKRVKLDLAPVAKNPGPPPRSPRPPVPVIASDEQRNIFALLDFDLPMFFFLFFADRCVVPETQRKLSLRAEVEHLPKASCLLPAAEVGWATLLVPARGFGVRRSRRKSSLPDETRKFGRHIEAHAARLAIWHVSNSGVNSLGSAA